jgi:four helix bundle protein
MPNHQTLKAWQHAQRLAVECVKAAQTFPEYEQTSLADQLRRACYRVPLNIAEGTTQRGSREYRRYLDIAWGSLAEVETALGIARDVGYLRPAEVGRLEALATMRRALDELAIDGVKTTIPLHRRIVRHADFIAGRVDTTWVEQVLLAPTSAPA